MLEKLRANEAILAGQPPMLASNVALDQDGMHTLQNPRCIVQHTLPCVHLASEECCAYATSLKRCWCAQVWTWMLRRLE